MAISKPIPKIPPRSVHGVDGLINKGGAQAGEQGPQPYRQVLQRIPYSDLLRVDACVQRRRVKITRTQWMLEAIVEKLAREERGG